MKSEIWEFSIIFNINKNDYANWFFKKVFKDIKNCKGIVQLVLFDNFTEIAIAVPKTSKLKISSIIKNAICELYLCEYKWQYITSNLNFKITNEINMQAFIKALIAFDYETDKYMISQIINLNDKIMVDEFFNFRLKVLKFKWNDLVNLANDNATYLMTKNTFLELLKFLISNLDVRYGNVNVYCNNSKYVLCDNDGKEIEDNLLNKREECNDIFLLTSIIALNPKKIFLHSKNSFNNQITDILLNLFNSRVEFLQ